VILAFDTAADRCAVALCEPGGGLRAERVEQMRRGHADRLFPLIEDAMAEAGAGWHDITRIAVCTGPGSFTGIRVGVAAARGLALSLGVPAVGITRFEALALAAIRARRFVWMPGDLNVVGERRSDAPQGAPGIAVAIAARGGCYRQDFPPDWPERGTPDEMRFSAEGEAPPRGALLAGDGWAAGQAVSVAVAPQHLARLAADRAPGPSPAPCYLRPADAAPPREAPPVLLD